MNPVDIIVFCFFKICFIIPHLLRGRSSILLLTRFPTEVGMHLSAAIYHAHIGITVIITISESVITINVQHFAPYSRARQEQVNVVTTADIHFPCC